MRTSLAFEPPGIDTATRRWPLTGALLVAAAVLAAVGATVLGAVFDWPAVLDEPGRVALPAFSADESAIRAGFYAELLSSLLLVPAAFGVQQALSRGSQAVRVLTTFGVAGALFQILGWVRWPVAVPGLAERFATGDETGRAATAAAYDVLNAYAGGAVGEHLGWLFQAPWAVAAGVLALRATGLPRWFGAVGVGSAIAWALLIVPEPYVPVLSGDGVSAVAFALYTVWFVWLAALGVLLAVRRVGPGRGAL
jgi:hypothetical protein